MGLSEPLKQLVFCEWQVWRNRAVGENEKDFIVDMRENTARGIWIEPMRGDGGEGQEDQERTNRACDQMSSFCR